MPDVSSRFLDQTAALPTLSAGDLALYELQQPFVEPLLRMFRFTNTALDVLFYDVEALRLSLLAKNTLIHTSLAARSVSHPFDFLDLTALTNPSGSIIVVDSNSAPYIRPRFPDRRVRWRGDKIRMRTHRVCGRLRRCPATRRGRWGAKPAQRNDHATGSKCSRPCCLARELAFHHRPEACSRDCWADRPKREDRLRRLRSVSRTKSETRTAQQQSSF